MLALKAYEALPEAERYVGQGKFGYVKKVKRISDLRILACKSIRFQDGETSKVTAEREYHILSTLDHPNIIKQVDVKWKPHKAMIYMEYCEGGSLQDLINERVSTKTPISEQYIWNVFFQLASALLYCHLGLQVDNAGRVSSDRRDIAQWNPVLHRDIKPGNVFLFSRSETVLDCVRLGDFGLGYVLQSDAAPETYAGTAPYLAPEINRTSTRSIHWTEHCDIFSLGCTIYALCMFKPPFSYHMETELETYEPVLERYSDQLRACIASCLSYYPQTRPNALRLFQQSQRCIISIKTREVEKLVPIISVGDLVNQTFSSSGSSARSKKRKNRKKITADCKALPRMATELALPAGETQDLANNVLREAVVKGDVDLTKKALDMEGVNPNVATTDQHHIPMLSLATDSHHDQVAKLLIDAGADVNQTLGDNSKTLHWAAKHNCSSVLQALLNNRVSVDEIDEVGRTALSYAAEEGYTDVVQLLLSAGANPNSKGFDKRTPLHWAALQGRDAIIPLLRAAGAWIFCKDARGSTAETLANKVGKNETALLVLSESPYREKWSRLNRIKLEDLKKFSENFGLLPPLPEDLVPILSNDKAKQEEIKRLNKFKYRKTRMSGASTATWIPDPTASTFVQSSSRMQNHTDQLQEVFHVEPTQRKTPHMPPNQRWPESSIYASQPEDRTTAPLQHVPPVPVKWSEVVRGGTGLQNSANDGFQIHDQLYNQYQILQGQEAQLRLHLQNRAQAQLYAQTTAINNTPSAAK